MNRVGEVNTCSNIIRIAAAVASDANGQLLLVRKRGTIFFMQPGGKIGESELPVDALIRELAEKLNLIVAPTQLTHLGRFEAVAANEANHIVEAELFALSIATSVRPAAEIDEVIWVSTEEASDMPLAPLTKDHVLGLHNKMNCYGRKGAESTISHPN